METCTRKACDSNVTEVFSLFHDSSGNQAKKTLHNDAMNSLKLLKPFSSEELAFRMATTASSIVLLLRKYASLHSKLFPLACGPMRTVILPNSSLACLITEKFSTVKVRSGRFGLSASDIPSPCQEFYRPNRCLPPIPMAPRPPRIMFLARPPFPICLNILAICAYWRSN